MLKEARAETIKQAKELARGYTWYTNTLEPKKGVEGAQCLSDDVLSVKVADQYLIFYKEGKK